MHNETKGILGTFLFILALFIMRVSLFGWV